MCDGFPENVDIYHIGCNYGLIVEQSETQQRSDGADNDIY